MQQVSAYSESQRRHVRDLFTSMIYPTPSAEVISAIEAAVTCYEKASIDPISFYRLLEQRPLDEFVSAKEIPVDKILRSDFVYTHYYWRDSEHGLVVLSCRPNSVLGHDLCTLRGLDKDVEQTHLYYEFSPQTEHDIVNRAAAYLLS
jgi:hypothetical protein